MFNADSGVVKNYVLLIQKGLKTIDDVPDFQNLREAVSDVLTN